MPEQTQTQPQSGLRFLVKLLGNYKSLIIQSSIIIVLMSIVNLPLPLLNKVVFDYLFPSGDALPIVYLGLLAFFVRASASAFQIFQNYVIRKVISGLGHDLRNSMMHAMLQAPYARYVSGEMNDYIGRITTDVQKIENIIFDGMRFIIRPLGMIILMIIIMAWTNVWITVLIFVIAPPCMLIAAKQRHALRRFEKEVAEHRQTLQRNVAESLENIRVIRGFNRQKKYQEQISETIDSYSHVSVSLAVRRHVTQNAIEIILLLPWLSIVTYGSWLVQHGTIQVGDLMLFVSFESLLRSPLGQLTFNLSKFSAELVAPERVKEVSDVEREPSGSMRPETCRGHIQFKDVSFSYDGNQSVIDQFNLDIQPGQRIAFVGSSGAGKTTLVNLLLGLYPVTSGQLLIDGHAMKDLNLEWYRNNIGIVLQDNPMFDGHIRMNLCLGRDYDDAALWHALDQAQAGAFVRSLPEQLETRIGTKGLKLSGGQRQRLAIARVLLRDPKIVFLDEATASLDSVTEVQIQAAMDTMLSDRSSITIAHRLGTIVKSDRICYLADGKITEDGSHGELIKLKGDYWKLYEAQVDGLLPS